ncbi:DUF1206 domain-containing protein [Gramella sp. KN1008]|uniref:DUF1206 domain-containing protein n=1 Tax=Gramella sp. KN1008 TaxID=2529298 RepID=UPI00103C15D9|nr:DUF1206 domain-containing protein [Gramella sp. KN1008]TBW29130.1 DUF1206 domain-containing protein [Gramella sp. KN1008]
MDSKIQKMARTGYIAKGIVYSITGILSLLATLNMGGKESGKTEVIEFLQKQAFGNVLLVLLAVGFLCYVGWRFVQTFMDPENIGSDNKGILNRIGFFISGLLYLSLAGFTIKKLIDAGSSDGGEMTFAILSGKFGVFVFVVAGLSFAGKSIYQFRKAFLGNFLKKFNYKSVKDHTRRIIIKNTAYLGVVSRGIVFGVLGFIFLRAAYYSNTTEIKDTEDAFSFLSHSYGAWLMGIVSAGFICYGIFMFATAKYRIFNV